MAAAPEGAISPERLGQLVSMGKRWVEKQIQAGKIQTIPFGSKKRIPPHEVARILKTGIA